MYPSGISGHMRAIFSQLGVLFGWIDLDMSLWALNAYCLHSGNLYPAPCIVCWCGACSGPETLWVPLPFRVRCKGLGMFCPFSKNHWWFGDKSMENVAEEITTKSGLEYLSDGKGLAFACFYMFVHSCGVWKCHDLLSLEMEMWHKLD